MRLVHYSDREVTLVRSRNQDVPMSGIGKPNGFWVSVEDHGDGWREWCEAEEFNLARLTHVHDVALAGDACILYLSNAADIDRFTGVYVPDGDSLDRLYPPWNRVAAEYQGVIIAPYVWERRLDGDARWYYSWDCASGCIWDASAIASVRLRVPAAAVA